MADIITPSGIIAGAVVSLGTLAAKYVFDRLTEPHKGEEGLGAKWRERYQAQRADAISGVYENLLRCLDRTKVVGLRLAKISADVNTIMSDDSRKLIEQSWQSYRELQDYFSANEIYLPKPLADVVGGCITDLYHQVVTNVILAESGIDSLHEDDLEKSVKAGHLAREVLSLLRAEFRKLME